MWQTAAEAAQTLGVQRNALYKRRKQGTIRTQEDGPVLLFWVGDDDTSEGTSEETLDDSGNATIEILEEDPTGGAGHDRIPVDHPEIRRLESENDALATQVERMRDKLEDAERRAVSAESRLDKMIDAVHEQTELNKGLAMMLQQERAARIAAPRKRGFWARLLGG